MPRADGATPTRRRVFVPPRRPPPGSRDGRLERPPQRPAGPATAPVGPPAAPVMEAGILERHTPRGTFWVQRYPRVWPLLHRRTVLALLGAVVAVGAVLRVWEIDAVGLNSDEAGYAGQGASIAGDRQLAPYFPTFRAHPLLFQTLLSVGFKIGHPEVFGRGAAAALGVATIVVTYLTGRLLYGRLAG